MWWFYKDFVMILCWFCNELMWICNDWVMILWFRKWASRLGESTVFANKGGLKKDSFLYNFCPFQGAFLDAFWEPLGAKCEFRPGETLVFKKYVFRLGEKHILIFGGRCGPLGGALGRLGGLLLMLRGVRGRVFENERLVQARRSFRSLPLPMVSHRIPWTW